MTSLIRFHRLLALICICLTTHSIALAACPTGQVTSDIGTCIPVLLAPPPVVQPTPQWDCSYRGGHWDVVGQYCVDVPNLIINSPAAPTYCIQSALDLIFPDLGNPDLEQIGAEAIDSYLGSLGLPRFTGQCKDTSYNRFRANRPDEAAAAVFIHLIHLAQTPPAQLKGYEQNALNAFAAELKKRQILATGTSYAEYQKWQGDVCIYKAPYGFPYSPPTQQCAQEKYLSTFGSLEQYATPPDFVGIGTIAAYPNFASAAGALKSSDVAKVVTQLSGSAGAAGGAVALTYILAELNPTAALNIHQAILPHVLEDNAEQLEARAARAASNGVSAIFDIVGRLAGPVGVLAGALVDLVFQALNVFADAQRGAKLKTASINAQNATINLNALTQTTHGLQEIYGLFCDALNLTPVLVGADPTAGFNATFTITSVDGTIVNPVAPNISYQTWGNSIWAATFHWNTGDFAHVAQGATLGHNDFIMNYTDWEGRNLTTNYDLISGVFLVKGYPSGISALSDTLYVVDALNRKVRYTLNNRATNTRGGLWTGGTATAFELSDPTTGQHLQTTTLFRSQGTGGTSTLNREIFLSPGSPKFGTFYLTSSYIPPMSDYLGLRIVRSGQTYDGSVTSTPGTTNLVVSSGGYTTGILPFTFVDSEGNNVNAKFQ